MYIKEGIGHDSEELPIVQVEIGKRIRHEESATSKSPSFSRLSGINIF